MAWLPDGEKNFENIFIRFGATHERDRRTDRQMDRHRMPAYTHITRLCIASRGKNYDNMLSRFHLIAERRGQTDGENCYISIARLYADARYI